MLHSETFEGPGPIRWKEPEKLGEKDIAGGTLATYRGGVGAMKRGQGGTKSSQVATAVTTRNPRCLCLRGPQASLCSESTEADHELYVQAAETQANGDEVLTFLFKAASHNV